MTNFLKDQPEFIELQDRVIELKDEAASDFIAQNKLSARLETRINALEWVIKNSNVQPFKSPDTGQRVVLERE